MMMMMIMIVVVVVVMEQEKISLPFLKIIGGTLLQRTGYFSSGGYLAK